MALRAIKSPSRFARHTGQSPTRNVYHISVRMLPGRGPGHMAPPVPAGRAHHVRPCPDPLLFLGRWRCAPFCALRVRRSPRCAWLRPLRRAAPAPASQPRSGACALASLAGAGPALLAPRSAARPVCALARSVGARWPRLPAAPPSSVLRAPCSVALASLGLGPCAARGPAGGRSAPLRGFGPGGSPPGPRCAAFGRAFSSRGPGFWLRARACPRLLRFSGFCVLRCLGSRARLARLRSRRRAPLLTQARFRGSPCFPPAPAAPLGLPGSARPPA